MNRDHTSDGPKLVRDLMTVGVVTCGVTTPITTIAQAVIEKELEAIVVLDTEGHALGYVGQDDLIRAYATGNYQNMTAQQIMRDGIPQVPPDIPIPAAAQLMQDQGLRVFFLTHHAGGIEYPAALITYKHFLRHLIAEKVEAIKDLGIRAERQAPLDTFMEKRDELKARANNIHLE